ncbi:cytochrome c3 family protein [Vibrio sp. SS-MA-C1-2]|uniref:cytochrome c3 family protein n=1 Tax=Vibrio sp. SS-MA-C1-2 TaxID=2908646 RepID=UPI001F2CBC63|nr:cytochrome c3 family protein [Vibrio sp. SS-MA-C1-2]UJF18694.1 cytochrome c3 family protein [Vibrio sp. SS-MA-C1-2]
MKLFKLLLAAVLFTSSSFALAADLPDPEGNNLANSHLAEDATCGGQCHEGEDVSEDLVFETESCIDCHGDVEELDGPQHNLVHREEEEMQCASCHLPHEEFDVKESCLDCHEETDEQLKGFYD